MNDKSKNISFGEALEGAKKTIFALEGLSAAQSRYEGASSNEYKCESDLNNCRKILDDVLAQVNLSEVQGRHLIAWGEQFIRTGQTPESVAQRWEEICYAHSKKEQIQFLSKQWKQKLALEVNIGQVDREREILRNRLEECGKFEEELSKKEQRNKEIDEKRARVKGFWDTLKTYTVELELKDELESLRGRIQVLGRAATEQQISNLMNRKCGLSQQVGQAEASISQISSQLGIPSDAMNDSKLSELEHDVRLAESLPSGARPLALERYRFMSDAVRQYDETTKRHDEAVKAWVESDDRLTSLEAQCRALLQEKWLAYLIDWATERFGQGPQKVSEVPTRKEESQPQGQVASDAEDGNLLTLITSTLGKEQALCVSAQGRTLFSSAFERIGLTRRDFDRFFRVQIKDGKQSNLNFELSQYVKSYPFVLYASDGLRHLTESNRKAANLIAGDAKRCGQEVSRQDSEYG